MRILILGGTRFVGRHLAGAAIRDGHHVTLFNRGRSNPGLHPAAEEIHGDREADLRALRDRTWDLVFDTCGYLPRVVHKAARQLRDAVGRYVFISSLSVYASLDATSEGSPVAALDDPDTEDILTHYGALKAACEQTLHSMYDKRALLVRPGFIVGPHDTIARLPKLLQRYDADGARLAGRAEQPVQLIDVRDLADWMLDAGEQGRHGEYNLTGHARPMHELLNTVAECTGRQTSIIWTDDAFLTEHGVKPIDGLTYWTPHEFEVIMRAPIDRALGAGLTLRPLSQTISETLAWVRREEPRYDRFGRLFEPSVITRGREAELLAAWRRR